MKEIYKQYWNEYRSSVGLPEQDEYEPLVDEFGDNPQTSDYLISLVLEGKKTATCGLIDEYQRDKYPIPKVGDQKILINGKREPVCVAEVTEVEIKPFSEINESFAYDEGEGDRSYEFWHKEHVKCFTRSMKAMGKEFNEQLQTVCERFKILYK
ncbi:conserved hypothetical protein [Verrucomicrobiia bacterium DG1235]|nr:conserved hypothetical protein [Verrucomicrobiae bacterium DG1235]